MERTIIFGIRKVSREDVKEEVKRLLIAIGGPVEDSSVKRWSYDLSIVTGETSHLILAWHYGDREEIPAYKVDNLRNIAVCMAMRSANNINSEQTCADTLALNVGMRADDHFFWCGQEAATKQDSRLQSDMAR